MKGWKISITLVCLLMFIVGYQSANAQENLAQQVDAIFQQSCLNCHGPSGSFKEALLIDPTALIESQVVIPGSPENSEFYKRLLGPTENGPQMPLNLPPLSPEAIETIAHWIAAGAPDWNVQRDINFVTTDTILDTIQTHLESLDPFDRSSARYFTMTHLYNAGETPETLSDYRIALSKLINSLSWKFEITNPTPIDEAQTIFHIDLRRYEWNTTTDVWPQIEQAYPYSIDFDPETQAGLLEKLTHLQTETGSIVPFVHLDWFLATASLPPLYHDILDLPQTDRILEAQLAINVANNIRNAPGIDVWRAGFNDSGVSRHNRVVERHTSRYGAYWKSYDFAGSAESQNIFTYPLDFTHDGGEIIFNLPNGLQAYLLVDANGNRLDDAPIDIVSNPAASDPTVRNGLSCIGCHTQGMKTFKDSVRAAIEQDDNPPYNKEQALRLYPKQSVLDDLVAKDTERFQQALEKIGGPFADNASRQHFFKQHENEPIQRFHELFQARLSASDAAAAVGLETEAFLTQIREKQSLKNLGLQTLIDVNGTVKRDAWTSAFHDVISEINSPNIVLPPVVQRPEIIPGAGVYIPDPNLRDAIQQRLQQRHNKAPGDVITVEDMAKLRSLKAVDKGIQDLTGLQYATNLESLEVWNNQISDLSSLKALINLRTISLADNQISDISPLTGLINAKNLYLSHNPISDLSPIKNLKNLSELKLWDCPVSDLSPLTELTKLTKLTLAYDYVDINPEFVDISPLTELTDMSYLVFHGVNLSDLSALVGMINLKFLKFDGNNVSDISPVANLINLEHIITWRNPISDFSPLAKLDKLKTIDICGADITDLSFLAGKQELTELYLVKNGISNISALAELTGLTRLDLSGNDISDVLPLASLTNLTWLKLSNNPITDFSPLEALSQNTNILTGEVVIPDPNLRAAIAEALGKNNTAIVSITAEEMATLTTLRASNRDIKDLTGIEDAINLEELWISKNPVSDISPLAKLKNLIGLGAWETSIKDLSPLTGLTKLRWLDFGRTPISNLAPLAGITSLRKLTFYSCDLEDISPLVELTGLTHLEVGGNRAISDASPVVGLINLEHLDFHHDSISDLSPLAGLTKLKSLNLYDNRLITDLSPLGNLTGLIFLHLHQNMISDVSPLARLINLENLVLRDNLILDISPLKELSVFSDINWVENPGSAIGGPVIEGPWMWMIVPAENLDKDWLAIADSGGVSGVTEQKIATYGARPGSVIGNKVWTTSKIGNRSRNISDMVESIGEKNKSNQAIYGSIILESPSEQKTVMLQGSNGLLKIWLNGDLVHKDISTKGWPYKYEKFFPVTLKPGANVLLVAIQSEYTDLSGFFGFEEGTEYTVMPPDVGFTFSAIQTNLLAGDTLTINLNAENTTDLAGWQADIAFDPNILEAVEVIEGDFLKTESGNTFFQNGTIDNAAGKITDLVSARISESGVSGTGTLLSVTLKAKAGGETQVTLENFEFSSISGEVIPAVPPNITITVGEYPPWDVNQDGRVSVADLVLVAKDLGSNAPANLRTDVNRDGVINIQDLLLVAQHLGESTDAAAPSAIAINDLDLLDPAMIQAWITQAQIENDGSLAFRQGIANLERLLALFIPEETALLHNYPNPFNPETWIPYQLAEPAEVTLTIYSMNGTLVRTLKLGYQPAGIYQTRTRAAYWDGKNEVGESVASGVYFYTFTADDFTATRKMLILK
ncbi:MAG: leucine-rich repeat domain-containing protein [Candidatus Poribacteria bacterium]|nr:leucine-rich repeat domain-containing protein [Candidatus Poribacteria bacterium]